MIVPIPISIHALREEGDGILFRPVMAADDFYPRPPRGGRRMKSAAMCSSMPFLSTPSARRATHNACVIWIFAVYFYPRPPRGGRHKRLRGKAGNFHFYPRPPRGGRPDSTVGVGRQVEISIHALREEGDYDCCQAVRVRSPISIHALREEGDLPLWQRWAAIS